MGQTTEEEDETDESFEAAEEEFEEEELNEERSVVEALCIEANEKVSEIEAKEDFSAEELDGALKDFQEAISIDENYVPGWLGLAYVYGLIENYEESRRTLEKAKEIDSLDSRIDDMIEALNEMTSNLEELDILPLIEKSQLTPGFIEILMKTFDRFDCNKDDSLNREELNNFVLCVNDVELDTETEEFFKNNVDCDENGVTRDGFLEFYFAQTVGDKNETISDLNKLGFDENLDPKQD